MTARWSGQCLLWPGLAVAVRDARPTEREGCETSDEAQRGSNTLQPAGPLYRGGARARPRGRCARATDSAGDLSALRTSSAVEIRAQCGSQHRRQLTVESHAASARAAAATSRIPPGQFCERRLPGPVAGADTAHAAGGVELLDSGASWTRRARGRATNSRPCRRTDVNVDSRADERALRGRRGLALSRRTRRSPATSSRSAGRSPGRSHGRSLRASRLDAGVLERRRGCFGLWSVAVG
jgi:hypothetical protein